MTISSLRVALTFIAAAVAVGLTACQSTTPEHKSSASQHVHTKPQRDPKAAANVNTQLGIAYLRQGNIERAQQKLLLAEKQAPNDPLVLDGMALFLEATGEPAKAESYYQKASKIGQNVGASQNNYGAFLCRQGRYKEAEQRFVAAVKDPNYLTPGQAYENAGLCAMMIPNYVMAESYFKKALQKQPDLPNSLLELGQIYYDDGKYNLAQTYLDRYSKTAKLGTAESRWLAVRVAWALGNEEGARMHASELRNSFVESQEYKEYLRAERLS